MQRNENYILRTIAGEDMLIPVEEAATALQGIITLNPVGAVIWKALVEKCDIAYAVEKVLENFEIDEATATADTVAFIEKLQETGLLLP